MTAYSFGKTLYEKFESILPTSFLKEIKKLYNSWYWRERIVKKYYGERKINTVYIIRRYATNMGIGSYVISNLSHIDYALKKGFTPIIDMYNYNSTDLSGKKNNTWTLFYKQPLFETINNLDNAYKQRKYILSCGGIPEDAPNDSMEFLCNKDKLKYWSSIYSKYCVLNDKTKKYFEEEYNELFSPAMRIVGVLCRGTDYYSLRPVGHPVQPLADQVVEKTIEVMREYSCNYIYLATEDKNIESTFRRHFGEKLITNKRVYKDYHKGYLAKTLNIRENDSYYTNLEYLSSLNLLSKCNCIIAGRTSGTVLTINMNINKRYE